MSISLNEKIEFLAETYGRDAYKAVNECPNAYIAWYESGFGTVAELLEEDERNKDYFNDLVEACEDAKNDIEFWHNLSCCLSGFVIDGNPYLDEDEDEE